MTSTSFPSVSRLIGHQNFWSEEDIKKQLILGIDPGQTTGVCLFDHDAGKPIEQQQVKTYPHSVAQDNLKEVICDVSQVAIAENKTVVVVMEDYRVYGWKTQDHSFSELFTPQLIGALKWTFRDRGWPVCLQMAQLPKKFVTNDKLKKWNIDCVGQTHARDATRHAVYHAIFGGSYAELK